MLKNSLTAVFHTFKPNLNERKMTMTLKITGTADELIEFIRELGTTSVTLEEFECEEDEDND